MELLVVMVLVMLLGGLLYAFVSQTGTLWQRTRGEMEQFREARAAFETITRRLSQATLNTYWDYFDAAGNRVFPGGSVPPSEYNRFSELHFLSGPVGDVLGSAAGDFTSHAIFFQAPVGYSTDGDLKGLNNLLNVCGFFVEYGGDGGWRPPFINWPERKRYRLIEVLEPSESMDVYGAAGADWVQSSVTPGTSRVLAENIIALILQPMRGNTTGLELAPGYRYDSRDGSAAQGEWFHQLPPLMNVTLVAIDEATASRLDSGSAPPLDIPLFTVTSDKERDLADLEAELGSKGANYQILETTVPLRAAKWSKTP